MTIREAHGFTMIELLIAMMVIAVGILALAESFVAAGKLTLVSERQAAMSHVARSELERLQLIGYDHLGMTTNPATSADPRNPDYDVSQQGANYYLQWDANSQSKELVVVDAAAGQVLTAPTAWSSPTASGSIYDFVTYHTDGSCGSACPASQNYKRVVVMVTQTTASAPKNPVIIQTLVADVNAAPTGAVANGVPNPLPAAGTQCQTGVTLGPCQIGIDTGTANSYWLYDVPASGSYGGPPSIGNTLHSTVGILQGLLCNAIITLGCPVPDLMGPTVPSSASSTLYNYSTDQGGPSGPVTGGGSKYQGGRILKVAAGNCSSPPASNSSTSNPQAETWVAPGVAASQTFNGDGGMTLFMQSANGVTVAVTVCAAIWVYPQSLLNLITVPPIEIGAFAYAVAALPTTPIPVSFTFNLGAAKTLTIGQRIGVEVWIAASSAANAAIQYDNPSFASQLQLNSA